MGDGKSDNAEKSLEISNILCYIATARHAMRYDDIVRVCLAFYSNDDVLKGKDLLFTYAGKKVKRRRNENRILHEMYDIMDLLKKCDEDDIKLPVFVADSYCGLPPSSGFEVIATHMTELNDQIMSLKKEVKLLRDTRDRDNFNQQNGILIQEDLLTIKGELRKLNHKLMGDNLRRNSSRSVHTIRRCWT